MKKVSFLKKVENIPLFVFLTIQAITIQTYSQAKVNPSNDLNNANSYKVYGSVAIGLGYPCSLGWGLNFLSKTRKVNHNIGFDLNLLLAAPIARELPSDFERLKPRDDLVMLSAMLAYEHDWGEGSSFGVSLGPSYLSIEKKLFTESNGWFTNYETYEKESKIAGLSLRIKTKYSHNNHVGLEVALHVNVNSYSPIIGVEFCFIFGKL